MKKDAKPSYLYTHGRLSEISDTDLYKFLCENEERDAAFLAIVCSELLRRQMADEKKSAEYED